MRIFIVLAVFCLTPGWSLAADEGNCRLMVHTLFENGLKRLSVEVVHAQNRADCKQIAVLRKLASEADVKVLIARVNFGYRGPAVNP